MTQTNELEEKTERETQANEVEEKLESENTVVTALPTSPLFGSFCPFCLPNYCEGNCKKSSTNAPSTERDSGVG